MSILQYILLFLAVLLGGISAFWFKSLNLRLLQLILSFVGAYILGIIVLHLIPDAYFDGSQTIGIWVLVGFFIQLFLERLSLGVEHGHIHDHHHANRPMFALQVMLGLSIHAFIEGLPLSMFADFHTLSHPHEHNHDHLFYGVMMHKAPEAFALTLLLLMSHFTKRFVIMCVLIFAAMSPAGAFVTQYFHFEQDVLKKIIAVVIGSLLHISTTILFEIDSTDEHKISWQKMAAIGGGIALSLLTIF